MSKTKVEKTIPSKHTKPIDSLVIGIGSAVGEVGFFQSFDTARKRLQKAKGTIPSGKDYLPTLYRTALGDAANGSFTQKLTSLYSGAGFNLIYKVLQRTMTFGLHPLVKGYVEENHLDLFASIFGNYAKGAAHTITGICLGAAEVILLPLDAMKIKMQTNKKAYKGESLLQIARSENLYKGISWTIGRNMMGSAGFWFSDYTVRSYMAHYQPDQKLSNLQLFVVSAIATTFRLICANPVDVIKTRIQAEKETISGIKIGKELIVNEGPRALLKGLGTALTTQGPKVMTSFFVAGKIREMLTEHRAQEEHAAQTNKC